MNINFSKLQNGLVPAIIQDTKTLKVLMLGFMNEEAYRTTTETGLVTFFSRTKNRLWTKGEESGHVLHVKEIQVDCDQDTLLIFVTPNGPTCHLGTDTCWGQQNKASYGFVSKLEQTIDDRIANSDVSSSYVASLFQKGINKIAQKVGEEAVEVVIEAKDDNNSLFLNESADLFFHYLLLLKAKGFAFEDVVSVLESREK